MKNVVFVLSGFQNPLRSELRNQATEMGATYSDDWNEKCTHLMYVKNYLNLHRVSDSMSIAHRVVSLA